MVAEFVLFTTTLLSHISAVYMGGVPLAEHDTSLPGLMGPTAGSILGGTSTIMF